MRFDQVQSFVILNRAMKTREADALKDGWIDLLVV